MEQKRRSEGKLKKWKGRRYGDMKRKAIKGGRSS